ncbi:MAG: cupin domain-containing protein [Deltaproteobacteria bacterium]
MKFLSSRVALLLILCVSLISWSAVQAEQEKEMKPDSSQPAMIMTLPSDITWTDVPPALPPGAKIAVLEGDPHNPGPYTLRLKMPANYKIPAHWHTMVERVSVISGTMNAGMGDKLDIAQGKAFPAGSFVFIPAKMNHFAWADEETIIQINGDGPFDINYINPADDPRNTK